MSYCFLCTRIIINRCTAQKIYKWMYLMNILAELEFGFGPVIFDRVMLFELWKLGKRSVFPFLLLTKCIYKADI